MKILVLNGSPKGKYSVTLQTVNYLQKIYNDNPGISVLVDLFR